VCQIRAGGQDFLHSDLVFVSDAVVKVSNFKEFDLVSDALQKLVYLLWFKAFYEKVRLAFDDAETLNLLLIP
jgi:hypothetical protein